MNIDLSGKRAIVTGSTDGIGFAVAEGLGKAGAHVIVTGREEAKTAAACEDLRRGAARRAATAWWWRTWAAWRAAPR